MIGRSDLLKIFVLLVVVSVGLYVAVKLVDGLHEDRRQIEKDLISGKIADRRDAAPPRPESAPTPVARSHAKDDEVLVVRGPGAEGATGADGRSRRLVVIRGDGSMARAPVSPKERGPIVVALLDRADVDALIRDSLAATPKPDGAYEVEITTAAGSTVRRFDAADVAALRAVEGRSFRAAAPPDAIRVRVAIVEGEGEAPAWPSRKPPIEHVEKETALDVARDRLADLAERLKVGAVYAGEDGRLFRVESIDLLSSR